MYGAGFFQRETMDVSRGRFIGQTRLVDVRRVDLENEPSLGEEFAASGRGGSENQHNDRG